MRVMLEAAGAAAVLLAATPVLALAPQSPSPAAIAGARFLRGQTALVGPFASDLQARMVGSGLRTDGAMAFSGDGSSTYGYLLSAESADNVATTPERTFEDELPTWRAPGVTTRYAPAGAQAKSAR